MFANRKGERRRWSIATVSVLGAVGLAVAGCGGGSSNSSGGGGGSSTSASGGGGKQLKNLAVSMYARDNPFFAEVVSGIDYQAKQKGISVDTAWAENNPVQEVNNIQNQITRHPDGLIVSPIDENAVIPAYAQAKTAGIPVITVTDNIAASGYADQIGYVGSQYDQTGRVKAKYMAQKLHGKGEIGVVHLIRGLDFTEVQWQGAKQVFSKYPGIKIDGEIYAGGAASNLGLNAAENLLTAHPNLAGIYVDNDPLALGVIQAVQNRHLDPKKFVIVGADGTPDGLKAVSKGQMGLTVDFCGFAQGQLAVDSMQKYLSSGQKPTQHSPQIAITKANVNQFLKPKPGCDAP